MSRLLVAASLAALASLPAVPASAQDEVAGSARAHFLASQQEDLGGAVTADLYWPFESLRIGGFMGAGAVPAEDDARNRVFMPLGVSLAFEEVGDVVGVAVRARAGLWGGTTQEVKLTAGGFVGGGAYLLFVLGDGVALDVGMDVWGIFGDGETLLLSPSVGLSWSPPHE